ncbi:hypothetical protein ACFL6S_34865 [Candidatus Poribacteria bacterium]
MSKRIIIVVVVLLIISAVTLVYYLVRRVPGDIDVKGDSPLTATIALAASIVSCATAVVTLVTTLQKSRKNN